MLKKWSDEGLMFLTVMSVLTIVLSTIWGAVAFLHVKFGVVIDAKPGSENGFPFAILFLFSGLYVAAWLVFFLYQFGCVVFSFLQNMRDAEPKGRSGFVVYAIFLALAALVYIEGKGKLW